MEAEIIRVIKFWTEGEFNNCIRVWLTVFASLCYCYYFARNIPKGFYRLLAIIPVIALNLFLPLNLHTLHLGGSSAFFLAWLANFNLLMFAFGKGPSSEPSISVSHFIAVTCLPIKIREFSAQKTKKKESPSPKTSQKGLKSVWNYAIKILIIASILRVYDYSDYIHPNLLLALYSVHMYLGLETILAIVGGVARTMLGIELEPQFDEPYLSTSLQDFWGRRWNIMVTRILRPTVYGPVLDISAGIMSRKWAPLPAILATFFVSGLMHELIFFYLGRHWPTGELTCFFMLHGVSLVAEVAIKKVVSGRWGLSWIVTGPLTVAFVMITGFWLFFPEFLRCDSMNRAFKEYAAMSGFMKDFAGALAYKSSNNATVGF